MKQEIIQISTDLTVPCVMIAILLYIVIPGRREFCIDAVPFNRIQYKGIWSVQFMQGNSLNVYISGFTDTINLALCFDPEASQHI